MSKKNRKDKEKKMETSTSLQDLEIVAGPPQVADAIIEGESGNLQETPGESTVGEMPPPEVPEIEVQETPAQVEPVMSDEDDEEDDEIRDAINDHGQSSSAEGEEFEQNNPVGDDMPDIPLPAEVPPTVETVTEVSEAMQRINALEATIARLREEKSTRKVNSGSKARPNVTYTLLKKPVAWKGAPQVAQLATIIFDEAFLAKHRDKDGNVKVAEPDIFAAVTAGHEAGMLRTRQNPVRIFQYYRSELLAADSLKWT